MKSLTVLFLAASLFMSYPVFAADASSASTAGPIERPTYHPGDWWIVEKNSATERQEVKTVAEGQVVIVVAGRTRAPYDVVLTDELNLVNGYSDKSGEAVTFAPHARSVSFPLQVGAKWGGDVTWTSPPSSSLNFRSQAQAVAWEKVTIGSTEYNALRIEDKNSIRGASTCWYVREAKRIVKCDSKFPFKVTDFSVK